MSNGAIDSIITSLCVTLFSYTECLCSCEDKFVQECGVARLWEVARFNFLLPHNYVLADEC